MDDQRTSRSGRDLRGVGVRDLATTLERFSSALGDVRRKGLVQVPIVGQPRLTALGTESDFFH
jgi:hypothetical protein